VKNAGWSGNIPTGGYGSLATSTTAMTVDYVRCYQLSMPAAPTGLSATPGVSQVALSWTGSPGAASYSVKRATTSGGPYTTVASGVTTTSYTDTGLTNGTLYYYVVSAVNFQGESPNTAQVSAKPPGTLLLAPTNDAYVRDGTTYATTNFGSATTLVVKSGVSGYRRNSHLKFDLTPVATVSAATLKLYVASANSDPMRIISLYSATTASWSEGTVTWNTAPGLLNLITTFNVSNTAGTWYNIDITSYIQSKKAAGVNNISFVLTNTGATGSTNDVAFASKEATTGDPQLVVVP
jgi:cellulose 1,4-beta-cellobiosidase